MKCRQAQFCSTKPTHKLEKEKKKQSQLSEVKLELESRLLRRARSSYINSLLQGKHTAGEKPEEC